MAAMDWEKTAFALLCILLRVLFSASLSNETDSPVSKEILTTQSYPNSSDVLEQRSRTGMNESFSQHVLHEEESDDSGYLAGIIIGCLGILTAVFSVFGFCIYKHYLRRNVTSMNFDNPVYRKTTEDQFSLEKNQYQPARSYPPSLEPLTSPGTNEFV